MSNFLLFHTIVNFQFYLFIFKLPVWFCTMFSMSLTFTLFCVTILVREGPDAIIWIMKCDFQNVFHKYNPQCTKWSIENTHQLTSSYSLQTSIVDLLSSIIHLWHKSLELHGEPRFLVFPNLYSYIRFYQYWNTVFQRPPWIEQANFLYRLLNFRNVGLFGVQKYLSNHTQYWTSPSFNSLKT